MLSVDINMRTVEFLLNILWAILCNFVAFQGSQRCQFSNSHFENASWVMQKFLCAFISKILKVEFCKVKYEESHFVCHLMASTFDQWRPDESVPFCFTMKFSSLKSSHFPTLIVPDERLAGNTRLAPVGSFLRRSSCREATKFWWSYDDSHLA